MEHALDASLTPSEVVFLRLVNRHTRSKELIIATLTAAIAAKQQSGEIALEQSDGGGWNATPTGKNMAWPRYSLESRLRVPERTDIASLVHSWLARDRTRPWNVAAKKIDVGLALRGIAKPYRTRFLLMRYHYDHSAVQQALEYAKSLPKTITSPALHADICDGVNQRRRPMGLHESLPDDPWMDETVEDMSRTLGELAAPFPLLFGRPAAVLFTLALYGLLAASARASHREVETALMVFALLLWVLPDRSKSTLHRLLDDLMRSRENGSSQPGSDLRLFLSNRSFALRIGVPLVALVATFRFGWVLLVIAVTAAVSSTVLAKFRRLSRDRIVSYVARTSEVPITRDVAPVSFPSQVRPVTLEIRSPADLQQPSETARRLVRCVRERGPAVRKLYYRAVASLVVGSLLAGLMVGLLLAPADASWKSQVTLTLIVLALVAIVLFVLRVDRAGLAGKRLVQSFSANTRLPDIRSEGRVVGIRPVLTPVVGGAWSGLLLFVAPLIPYPVAAGALVAVVSAYLGWLAFSLRSLEKSIPAWPPFDLLALRVFGSPSLDDFLELTYVWRWIGTIARLDGPDTAGTHGRQLWAGLRNRVSSVVVITREQLAAALAEFSDRPDWQLRYATNSMQCADATWRSALDELLARADLVVMDLSGFGQANRGCRFELGRLLDRMPLRRVLLLINQETDLMYLRQTLQECANNLAADSPNCHSSISLELLQLGAQALQPNESLHEWRARLERTVDQDRLAAFLVDRALEAWKERHPDEEWKPADYRWCRPPLPPWALVIKGVGTAAIVAFAGWHAVAR